MAPNTGLLLEYRYELLICPYSKQCWHKKGSIVCYEQHGDCLQWEASTHGCNSDQINKIGQHNYLQTIAMYM